MASADATPSAPRVYALVLNKHAGAPVDDAAATLGARFGAVGIRLQEPEGHTLSARIAAAAESEADALVVVGGDGTVACACQHLAARSSPDRDMALAIVPAGTMNMLARDLRLPVGTLDEAASALITGERRRIDVGRVGKHIFACACMLGAPARIGRFRELARKPGHGPLAWLRVIRFALRAALRQRRLRLTLTVDGHARRLRTFSLNITVNRLDDASGRAYGRTVMDGGEICAYVVRPYAAWDVARLGWNLLTGSSRDRALQRYCGREIVVEGSDAAIRTLIDGEEHLLTPPLRFSVLPAALCVIVPAARGVVPDVARPQAQDGA